MVVSVTSWEVDFLFPVSLKALFSELWEKMVPRKHCMAGSGALKVVLLFACFRDALR